jgi:hypothetical protein
LLTAPLLSELVSGRMQASNEFTIFCSTNGGLMLGIIGDSRLVWGRPTLIKPVSEKICWVDA